MPEPKENIWKTPAAVIGLITAMTAVFGLIINYIKEQDDKALERAKIEYQAKLDSVKQRREDEASAKRDTLRARGLKILTNRLADINVEIQHCKEQIGGAQLKAAAIIRGNAGMDPEKWKDAQPATDEAKHYNARWEELKKEKVVVEDQIAAYKGVQ